LLFAKFELYQRNFKIKVKNHPFGNFLANNSFRSLKSCYFCPVEEKKIELIARCAVVFLRLGVRSVTMEDLAREIGVSKKTLYVHFHDKSELINQIIDQKLALDRSVCEMGIEQGENAIDSMLLISRSVIENISSISPTVFFDLKKHYPEAWQKMADHKWGFVYTMFLENIRRGMDEGLYRTNMDPDIIARLYVASTDLIMAGEVYPWPEYHYGKVFLETFRFHIRGMASDEGIAYLKERIKRETNE